MGAGVSAHEDRLITTGASDDTRSTEPCETDAFVRLTA